MPMMSSGDRAGVLMMVSSSRMRWCRGCADRFHSNRSLSRPTRSAHRSVDSGRRSTCRRRSSRGRRPHEVSGRIATSSRLAKKCEVDQRRNYTAPGSQVLDVSTGTTYVEKVDGEADSYVLHVNGVPSSSITLSDPQRLDFEYLDWMRRAIDVELPEGSLRAVHIGAAGCALARALDAARQGSKQTAIDIDAALLDFARQWFDLPRSPALALRAGDGAAEISRFRPDALD